MPAAPSRSHRPLPPPPRPPDFPVSANDLVPRQIESAKAGLTLPYRLYVPRDYLQSQRYSLLLVLHGVGERGTDNAKQLVNGVLAWCAPALQRRHPTFVVYPQCPESARWVEAPWEPGRYDLTKTPISRPMTAVVELLAALVAQFTIDPARLLVSGLSMGGFGAWDLITRFPERFAGAMPVCGGGDPTAASVLKTVPVWAFHGAEDPVVPVSASRMMVEAVRKAGGRVKYTEYPGVGHAAWDKAYADRQALEWLLSQQRKKTSR